MKSILLSHNKSNHFIVAHAKNKSNIYMPSYVADCYFSFYTQSQVYFKTKKHFITFEINKTDNHPKNHIISLLLTLN